MSIAPAFHYKSSSRLSRDCGLSITIGAKEKYFRFKQATQPKPSRGGIFVTHIACPQDNFRLTLPQYSYTTFAHGKVAKEDPDRR